MTTALEPITVSKDNHGFIEKSTGNPFVPWGFNYDHDRDGRLIEDYWDAEWETVSEDFREMQSLGANVVRVHLQLGRFMESAEQPRQSQLDRLAALLQLAEQTELYLDLTGLGCYHKADVPDWYDALSEADRWAVQGRFWEAIAKQCAHSPAVFCYDLMNEPVVPAGQKPADWLGPAFGDKHFVQRIGRELGHRDRPTVARDWIRQLTTAIRQHDQQHLITVGLVPWSLKRPGLQSGFEPEVIGPEVDFVAVHIYPDAGKLDEALTTLKGFDVGKPVVIEETFTLKCGRDEFRQFLNQSRSVADGWIGFYWGALPVEYEGENNLGATLTQQWLQLFQEHGPAMKNVPPVRNPN
ncbi:MAG: cellulase family glycosylhydrolase [Planctomycetaceae bacterium]